MMPKKTIATLLLIVGSLPALAEDVRSQVDAVTLYPSGATVTRVASVSLPAGTTTLRLTGLVNNLDSQQVRLEATDKRVSLGQVRVSQQQQRSAFNAEIERLNTEIVEVESRIAVIDDSIRSAELRLKFLDGLAQGYAKEAWHGGAQGTADIASWREALALLESASAEAYGVIRQQKTSRTDAERDLSVLQRELANLRGGALSTSTLELTARTSTAVDTEIQLHYLQGNARWQPLYEARLDSDTGELTLIQQAEIYQDTAEAWENVRLALSTSDPSGSLAPEPLDSEFLDLFDPVTRVAKVSRVASDAAGALEEVVVTGAGRAVADVGNFAVTYDIPGRVSVDNSTDDSQTVDIDTSSFDVQLVTRIVPRQSEQAFLAARLTYARNVPLYGSSLRVYVDGAYAGIANMPSVLPNSEVTLPMGDDRRVEIRAIDQGKDRGREGIISRKRTETTNYLFEITNRRQQPTVVEVLDRYPVPRNRDIEVEVADDATDPTVIDLDDQPGVVLWRRQLAANEDWRIHHEYTITYPADKRLGRR